MNTDLTELPKITFEALCAEYGGEPLEKLKKLWTDADGFVVYENKQLDSSAFGQRSCLRFGPACQFKTLADLPPWLNDLPSQRQYPTQLCLKEGQGDGKA